MEDQPEEEQHGPRVEPDNEPDLPQRDGPYQDSDKFDTDRYLM